MQKGCPAENGLFTLRALSVKDGVKVRHVIAVEHADIADGGLLGHAVAHNLEHAVEIGGDDHVDEVLRDHALLHAFAAEDFHVLVGIFDLNIHKIVEKMSEVRPMRAAEQQAEFVEVVVDIVEHSI